jgi:hypothetical protein
MKIFFLLNLNNVSLNGFIAVAWRLFALERIKQQGAKFVVESSSLRLSLCPYVSFCPIVTKNFPLKPST